MPRTFQALYENGVFRPLAPIELEDRARVTLTVHVNGTKPNPFDILDDLIEWDEIPRDEGIESAPSLEEVREMLAKIPGKMSDVVIAQRDERF
jgi:predicted DNA-binding antitoxin AbrB/MazE fold protein